MPELVEDHIGYHRLTVIGGDRSIPFGNFVFRGEIADNIDDGGHHQGNALAGLDWAATDQIHALLGYDFFHAEGGMFVRYARNSEVWIKLKYSF